MPDKTGLPEPAPDGQVLIYQDGATHLQVRLEGRTVWLSQRLSRSVPGIGEDRQRAPGQHLQRARTRPRGNYPEFPDSSNGEQP